MIDDMVPFDSDRDTSSADSHGFNDDLHDSSQPDAGSKGDAPFGFGAGVEGDGGSAAGATTSKPPGGKRKPARKRSSKRTKKASGSSEARASEAVDTAPPQGGDDDGAARKTKRKRTRRKKAPTSSEGENSPQGSESSSRQERAETGEGTARKAKARRGSRRKSSRGSSEAEQGAESTQRGGKAPEAEAAEAADADDGTRKRRRRGSRGGRRRSKGAGQAVAIDAIPGEEDELPTLPGRDDSDREEGGKKRKRKRSGSKKSSSQKSPGRDGDDADSGSKKKRKRSKKKSKSGDPDEVVQKEVEREEVILINAVDPEEKRVAVIANGRIADFMMNSDSQKTLVNDIYRGKVVNLEPAIGAAFVDFGQGRNGFLHTSDVLEMYGDKDFTLEKLLTTPIDHEIDDDSELAVDDDDEDDDEETGDKKGKSGKKKGRSKGRSQDRSKRRARKRLPITDLIRVGDQVVVQVTKDAIGDKGPTLTTYVSIPGRYLVLMPSMARTGVSRKIPDDKERRRLKRILTSLKAPEDMGVIVRTAGVGKTKSELQRDLDYLLGVWEHFGKRLRSGRGPTPLYQESDVATRTLRDLFNTRTKSVECDDPIVHESLIEFANKLMPEHTGRIHKHEGDRPIFHHHGIEQDFEKIFARRVELPSGGSIVFDQAEALVAIDVNSGRTRTDSYDFEEVALKTNLEAVPEIARQIRLRDLGGILVCDFIDMMKSSSNRSVERALRQELSTDRARSKLGRISQFGLLEMTRQRLGPGMFKKVFNACPRCRGTGHIRTIESRAQGILRRLGSALTQKGFTTVEVRGHPEVIDYLEDRLYDYIRALEHRFEKKLTLVGVADQPEDSVLRYLRADGREVRPGGRRKR